MFENDSYIFQSIFKKGLRFFQKNFRNKRFSNLSVNNNSSSYAKKIMSVKESVHYICDIQIVNRITNFPLTGMASEIFNHSKSRGPFTPAFRQQPQALQEGKNPR